MVGWGMRFFGVPPGAHHLVLLVAAYTFGTASSYIVHRAASKSLFLTEVGADYLPLLYMASAATVVVASLGYSVVARSLNLLNVIRLSLVGYAVAAILLRQCLGNSGVLPATVTAIVLLNELRGSLNTIQFSTLVNDLFADSDPKRIFAFLGVGATLAGVTFGLGLGVAVSHLGSDNVLYLAAVIDLLTLIPTTLLARATARRGRVSESGSGRSKQASVLRRPLAGLQVALKSPLARSAAVLTAIAVLVNLLAEFQWERAAAVGFAGRKDALTGFFSTYYAVVYLSIGTLQLTCSGWYLRTFGIGVGLLTQPAALGATMCVGLFSGFGLGLGAATAVKGCEIFKRAVNDPTMQLLYWPLDGVARRQAIAFSGGIVKPLAEGFGALLMLSLKDLLAGPQLVQLSLVLVGGWIVAALHSRTRYVEMINQALKEGRSDIMRFDRTPGPAVLKRVRTALDSSDPMHLENTLELLRSFPVPGCGPYALVHLYHSATRVRLGAIRFLATQDDARLAPHLRPLFEDADPEVRREAVKAYCTLLREGALREVLPLLDSPDADLAATALLGLHRNSSHGMAVLAPARLANFALHPEPRLRAAVAEIVFSPAGKTSLELRRRMLQDKSVAVISAALKSVQRDPDPDVAPDLLAALGSPVTAQAAADALVALGTRVLPQLATALHSPATPMIVRIEIVRLLQWIPDVEAIRLASLALDEADEDLIGEALHSLQRLCRQKQLGTFPVSHTRIEATFRRELRHYFQRLADWVDSVDEFRGTLLAEALERLVAKARERVLLCLAITHRELDFVGLARGLLSRGTRLEALGRELLANSVQGVLAPAAMAAFGSDSPTEALRAGERFFALRRDPTEDRLRRFAADRNDWLEACALHEIGRRGWIALIPEVRACVTSPTSTVREAALLALERLDPAEAETAARALVEDTRPGVQAMARRVLAALAELAAPLDGSPLAPAAEHLPHGPAAS